MLEIGGIVMIETQCAGVIVQADRIRSRHQCRKTRRAPSAVDRTHRFARTECLGTGRLARKRSSGFTGQIFHGQRPIGQASKLLEFSPQIRVTQFLELFAKWLRRILVPIASPCLQIRWRVKKQTQGR